MYRRRCSLRTETEQRGTENAETDDVRELRRTRGRKFLVDHDLLHRRPASAAELRGPRPSDEPGAVAGGLPPTKHGHPVVERVRQLLGAEIIAREKGADLIRERALGGGFDELHRTEIVSGHRCCVTPG